MDTYTYTDLNLVIKPETLALLLDIEHAESTCHKVMIQQIIERYVADYVKEAKEMPLPSDSDLLLNAVKILDS